MAEIRFVDQQTLAGRLRDDLEVFDRGVWLAAYRAAERANESSRERFTDRLGKRPTIKPRPSGKRPTTQGTFATHIRWAPTKSGSSVHVDVAHLNRVAPYWLIQEIGTGKNATARTPAVHGAKAVMHDVLHVGTVRVKSQVGRRIPSGLVWSGTGGNDQIVPGPRTQPITIRREIEGKHYLRTGGTQGFNRYTIELENAFMNAFGHHPKRTI